MPLHFSPDLLDRLVEAIFLLTRTKEDVFQFLRGCGIPESEFHGELAAYDANRDATRKMWIARRVVERVNSNTGDRYLGYRRALIHRIVEWDDFSQCWPDNQKKARATVTRVRDIVSKKAPAGAG